MEENTQKTKKSVQRSTAYPSFTLEQAIEDAQKLKTNLGEGPYSRDQAAIALGYKGVNGKSASRVASIVHYGLLERKGSAYAQSELSKRILTSLSDREREEAVVEALKSPTLYSKLIIAYDGQAIPQMLDNVLVRQYGIADKVAATASQIFRDSAEYANVLNSGIITADGKISSVDSDYSDSQQNTGAQTPNDQKPAINQGNGVELVIPGTEVVIIFPEEYAFNLSMGDFSKGVKQLKDDIEKIASVSQQSIQSDEDSDAEGDDM